MAWDNAVSSDEARALARQFANFLRHRREFHGGAYVSAAPATARPGVSSAGSDNTRSGQPDHPPRARSEVSTASEPVRDPVDRESSPKIWPERQVSATPVPPSPVRLPVAQAAVDSQVRTIASQWSAAEKLHYLQRKNIGNCQRCKLSTTRTHVVFGVGDPGAALMFIGEAPGFDEDRNGEPFVGAAGRRLNQWLGRLGMQRDQVYIANVLKCRPPGNRDPEPDEVERCSPFLRAQIRAIAPKVIVCLGRYAGMLLLGKPPDITLREMRSRGWTYVDPGGAHVATLHVTYHPSYVLRREKELPPGQRNPADDTVMADLQQAISKLRIDPVSPQNS